MEEINWGSRVNFSNQMRETKNCALKLTINIFILANIQGDSPKC